jgi:DNA-binding NtrC family response regulator
MTTQPETVRRPDETQRRCLLVIGESSVAKHDLPESGELVLGRDPGCDIAIPHESLSRRHALLRVGPEMTIEDLDSMNGTTVREQRLPPRTPVALQLHEVVDLGGVMIVVQQRGTDRPTRRIWSHGYFEARLVEECARAESERFSVVRIACEGVADAAIEDALRADLGATVVGRYLPGHYEALVGGSVELARVRECLEARQISAHAGVAYYPRDARDADGLLAAAAPEAGRSVVGPAPDGGMQGLRRLVQRIAASTINVLILGETGVGKEMLAESVHRESPRAGKQFLRLHCAALSESLLESELFGHEKGAFTGAVATKQGLLETAEGGTVFLDELGELSPATQVKLLRVIETREMTRVGGLKPVSINVRFVAATNRDLEAEITRGTFRSDLYFRLNGISLTIPPLRSRRGEIRTLAQTFAERAAREIGRTPEISEQAMALLEGYSWPGNIRELRNVIERAVLLCGDDPISPEHLPLEKMRAVLPTITHNIDQLKEQIRDLDKEAVLDALARCAGNQSEAAALLGITRRALVYKLDQYRLPRPRKGRRR